MVILSRFKIWFTYEDWNALNELHPLRLFESETNCYIINFVSKQNVFEDQSLISSENSHVTLYFLKKVALAKHLYDISWGFKKDLQTVFDEIGYRLNSRKS